MQIKTIRLPTCEEMLSLAAITKGDNRLMHWADEYSWCQDKGKGNPAWRAVMGCDAADGYLEGEPSQHYIFVGLRPVFEIEGPEGIPDGVAAPVAALYMGGRPLKAPFHPICVGDIPDYIPGAALEFQEAMDDPAYQVKAIRVGDILIADRVLIKNISWNDLHGQGFC